MEEESLQEIFAEQFTVNEKVKYITETLKVAKAECYGFVWGMSRQEIVCMFLAVLS